MGVSSLFVAALLPLLSLPSLWAPGPAANQKGNQAFRKGDFPKAVGQYDKALEALPAEKRLTFNRGTALLGGQKLDDALASLMAAAADPRRDVRGPALYNAGNALFAGQKVDQALDAWRQSILADPTNMEAKYNYELARRQKEQQPKQQGNQNQKDQNQKNQSKQDQSKQDQQNQQNQPQQQQQQNQQNQNQQPNPADQPPAQNQQPNPSNQPDQPQNGQQAPMARLTKEQAERLLDALQANEKKLMKDRLKSNRRKDVDKDW